ESSSSGDPISGLDRVPGDVEVTHAGTARRGAELVTAGGRVLNVTALGADPSAARTAAYAAAEMVEFPGRQLRRDIGARAVSRVRGAPSRSSPSLPSRPATDRRWSGS